MNSHYEPGGAIGGPILTNKAWFFAAYQPSMTKITRTVTPATSGLATAVSSVTAQTQNVQNLLADETMQLGPKLRTRVSFNDSWQQNKGQLASQNGSDKAGTDYTKGTTLPNYSLSGTADYVVSPKLFIGVRAGRFLSDQHDFNVQDVAQFVYTSGNNIGLPGVPASGAACQRLHQRAVEQRGQAGHAVA